jgi:hypothetical protein
MLNAENVLIIEKICYKLINAEKREKRKCVTS